MTKSRVLYLINQAIHEIEEYLKDKELPYSRPFSYSQLKQFKEALLKMASVINNESIHEVIIPMGAIIVDSWPIHTALAEKIVKAEQAYRKYQKSLDNG